MFVLERFFISPPSRRVVKIGVNQSFLSIEKWGCTGCQRQVVIHTTIFREL
jgi:hypothetical protein